MRCLELFKRSSYGWPDNEFFLQSYETNCSLSTGMGSIKQRATQQGTWQQKHLNVGDLREICVMVTGTYGGVSREIFDT